MSFSNSLKRKIKRTFYKAKGKQKGIHVLTYHGLIEERTFPRLQRNFHTIEEFKDQIKFLKKSGVLVLKPEEFEEIALRNESDSVKKAALLTFDDGYKNNELAMEILDKAGFKAVYFISTGSIGTDYSVWTVNLSLLFLCGSLIQIEFENENLSLATPEERKKNFDRVRMVMKTESATKREEHYKILLDQFPQNELQELIRQNAEFEMFEWNRIEELSNSGQFFQSHGANHELLHSNQTSETVNYELSHSKHLIEHKLGKSSSWFAYPNGDDQFSNLENTMIKHGYKLGFSLGNQSFKGQSSPLFIPRYAKPRKRMLELIF